jgi:hypothetical protein
MPITDSLTIKYSIPQEYLNIINLEFLSAFREELYKMNYVSLGSFYDDSLSHVESTSGWSVAFKLACINTNKENLYKYWQTLPWYDSDLFDYELSKLLIQNKLIIGGSLEDVIAEKLGIEVKDIFPCLECGKYYFKKDMIADDDYYKCIYCNGFDSHQYYLEGLKKTV